jgi:3-oxoacyl-[acyl-carrier protein] reductase
MDLHNRVALLTGASGGLGAVTACALADQGAHVAVTHLGHRDEGLGVCRQIENKGRKSLLVHLDQIDPASCSTAVEAAVAALGRLDILINNAAWNDPVPFQDLDSLTLEIWDRALNTNLRGPLLMTRAAVPHLKRQDQGRVVNVSGIPGLRPMGSIALAVSKAGLIHLTRCLAVALAPSITVNCVVPGLIELACLRGFLPPALRYSKIRPLSSARRILTTSLGRSCSSANPTRLPGRRRLLMAGSCSIDSKTSSPSSVGVCSPGPSVRSRVQRRYLLFRLWAAAYSGARSM